MDYVRPDIAAMTGYAPGEQPPAGKTIKLNTNENPYPPSARVTQAIQAAVSDGLARYPDPMAQAFRLQASEVLGIPPDWILCGNGSDDLLTVVTRAFVAPGQMLRTPYPSYVLYDTLAQIQGAAVERVPFQSDWSLGEDFFSSAGDPRLVFLPNPNSPSGTIVSAEQIGKSVRSLPCPLVVDEAYVDFSGSHCLDLVARDERILVTRTMSKSYALAGIRFGFVVAQPQVIEQLAKVKDSYNCDTLAIAGATAALADVDWLRENVARVVATRERLADRLTGLGFTVVPSQANFVWCTHADRPNKQIYEQLKAAGVLVRYMDYSGWGDGIRISVGTNEQIDALLSLIEEMV